MVKIGNIFKDSRTGDNILLVYLDSNVFLLRDRDGNHRIGKRQEFEENLKEGRYKPDEDAEPFGETGLLVRLQRTKEKLESMEGRKASHKAEAFGETVELLTNLGNEQSVEEVPFEQLDNIGEKAAENLRKHGYITCGDINSADNDELSEVPWVGEKGIDSLRDWCKS